MRIVLTLVLIALLTGCASEQDPGLQGVMPAKVTVDNSQLRQLKTQAGVEPCKPGKAAPVDGGLPDLTLPCLGGGKAVDLSRLRGPLVINLWQSTCGPCRTEMPILERFHDKYAGRVGVLGIDYQDVQPTAALQLVQKTGVTYPLLADPQASLNGADPFPLIRGLPMLALVDRDGKVVHLQAVAIRSLGQLEDLVDQHLGVGAA